MNDIHVHINGDNNTVNITPSKVSRMAILTGVLTVIGFIVKNWDVVRDLARCIIAAVI